jgi:hypothetical protein
MIRDITLPAVEAGLAAALDRLAKAESDTTLRPEAAGAVAQVRHDASRCSGVPREVDNCLTMAWRSILAGDPARAAEYVREATAALNRPEAA